MQSFRLYPAILPGLLALGTPFLFAVEEPTGARPVLADLGPTPALTPGQTQVVLPAAPAGYSLSILGSDREPVIGRDGIIHPPLVDQTVGLILKVSKTTGEPGPSAESAILPLKVPGIYPSMEPAAGTNPEPPVIPAVREWHGEKGATAFHTETRVVIRGGSGLTDEAGAAIARDVAAVTGWLPAVIRGESRPGDIVLVLDPAVRHYGPEGYRLEATDRLTLTAPEAGGLFHGSRTLLQTLRQREGHTSFPCGTAVDYPKYSERGLTLDVSRKFYPIAYLRALVRELAYFKLNVLHVHLTDDQGFRLESETFPGLAAADGHYTKKEFRELIELGAACGVTVVPEINGPGHVGAILRYRPGLGSHGAFDLHNPAGMAFMKQLWAEYLAPEQPTFPGARVHIGADEVETATAADREQMRAWMNEISAYVGSFGKEAAVWGGLDRYAGATGVDPRLRMDLWNWGWGNAATAFPVGYRLTNVDDGKLYIVPYSGIYRDYLDSRELYRSWEPNQFPGLTVPAGHPQVSGARFALWNDRSPSYGISMDDTTDRLLAAMPAFSEKCWGGGRLRADYETFLIRSRAVDEDPMANLRHSVTTVAKDGALLKYRFDGDLTDASGNGRTAISRNTEFGAGEIGQALRLKGGESYVATPLAAKGFGYSVSFTIRPQAGNPADAVILESPQGSLTLNTGGSGRLGFTKEGDTTLFDFSPPAGEWTDLTLTGDAQGTCLYVNGDEPIERLVHHTRLTTFVLPLARIGSDRHAMVGEIDNFTVLDHAVDPTGAARNLALNQPATASSWELQRDELAPAKAVDGDPTTRWSTAPEVDGWLRLDLGKEETIDKAVIHWEIRRGAQYRLLVSTDGVAWANVLPDDGVFTVDRGFDPLAFAPVRARYVKFQGVKLSNWGYAIFELELYGPGGKLAPGYREDVAEARRMLGRQDLPIEVRRRCEDRVADFPLESEARRE